jgi:hypothetical protein
LVGPRSRGDETRATESWRAVPGYASRYEVSDEGRIRSWFVA